MSKRFDRNLYPFIRRQRRLLKLTQEQLGDKLGVTGDFIGLIETGRRRLDLDRIPALAEALQTEPMGMCLTVLCERAPRLFKILFPEAEHLTVRLPPPRAKRPAKPRPLSASKHGHATARKRCA